MHHTRQNANPSTPATKATGTIPDASQPVRAEGLGRNADGGSGVAHAVGVRGIQETVLGNRDRDCGSTIEAGIVSDCHIIAT